MGNGTGSEEPHGHFSEGQEVQPEHTPDKEHEGDLSEGQAATAPQAPGRFSEGQEAGPEHTPEKEREGYFGEGQERVQ